MRALLRQPYSVLGAFGLLGLVDQLVTWQRQLGLWVEAWQSVSHRVAEFLFGWLVDLLPFTLPEWWRDYVAMGLIVGAAATRAALHLIRKHPRPHLRRGPSFVAGVYFAATLTSLLIWPLLIVAFFRSTIRPRDGGLFSADARAESGRMFFESFLWAAGFVAVNYALLVSLG